MKGILILLIGMALFVSVGQAQESPVAAPAIEAPGLLHDVAIASSSEAIAGTWYSFPVGIMIRFHEDGLADFGLDTAGNPIGDSAKTWFEGQQLFISFTGYDGENESCETAVGVYEVQMLEKGGISFKTVADDCRFRSDVLSGTPELGFQLVFHPVES